MINKSLLVFMNHCLFDRISEEAKRGSHYDLYITKSLNLRGFVPAQFVFNPNMFGWCKNVIVFHIDWL